MINGVVVGVVVENQDPDGSHRVLVEFPVESGEGLKSSWARMLSPMAGTDRGLVILPDKGTEVVLAFAYRTMSPYILGAVYNGAEDKPEPYHNDDSENNKRVFWSRNDHMVIFDDTAGAEKVQVGAQASARLDVTSAPIHQTFDSSEKVITMYCEKDTEIESVETISIKCKDFALEAETITISGGTTGAFKSGTSASITSTGEQTYKGGRVNINPSASPADPKPVLATPEHSHPPTS